MEEKREDLLLRAACKELYGDVTASDTLKENVIAAQKPKATIFKTGRLSFAAMLALVCVLVAGAGTVYALENSMLRSFLGKGSEHFEEIYADLSEDYPFGSHVLHINGVVYEDVVGVGYLSFGVKDENGTLVQPKFGLAWHYLGKNADVGRHIQYYRINAGRDSAYIIMTYVNSCFWTKNETEGFICFREEGEEKDPDLRMQFAILNQKEWEELVERVNQLDTAELRKQDWEEYEKTGDSRYRFGRPNIYPEVEEILKDYNFRNPDFVKSYTQEIQTPHGDFYVGRTTVKLYFDTNDPIESLVLLRENGTRTELITSDMKMTGIPGGSKFLGFKNGFQVRINSDGKAEATYDLHDILGAEEDVSIELNGTIYK